MGCLFDISVDDKRNTLEVDSTVDICEGKGQTIFAPFREEAFKDGNVGTSGIEFVRQVFQAVGVTQVTISPYHIKVELARLFTTKVAHEIIEAYIRRQWPDAEITGDRTEDAEEFLHFKIVSGPSFDDIMRVLQGNPAPGDNDVVEALFFEGHMPNDSRQHRTVMARCSELRAKRFTHTFQVPMLEHLGRRQLAPGERIIWDLMVGEVSIGQLPNFEQLRQTPFSLPGSTTIRGVKIRYHDVFGIGEVVDIDD